MADEDREVPKKRRSVLRRLLTREGETGREAVGRSLRGAAAGFKAGLQLPTGGGALGAVGAGVLGAGAAS